MKHGDIRALEDEQDPERRKALLERLLQSVSTHELESAMSPAQRRRVQTLTSFRDHTTVVYANEAGEARLDISEYVDSGEACPVCTAKRTIDFVKRATVILNARGVWNPDEPDEITIDEGPALAECHMCGAKFYLDALGQEVEDDTFEDPYDHWPAEEI